MEEDLGHLEAANELRIRRGEQQWEFVIPSSFTTRPDGSALASDASTLLQSLLGTLNRFFSVRSGGSMAPGGSAAARGALAPGSSGSGEGGVQRQQLMAELLPSDYRTDLSLEEIISEAAALDVSSSSNSSSGSRGSRGAQQQSQQRQQSSLAGNSASHAADNAGSNGRSGGAGSSSDGNGVAAVPDEAAAAAQEAAETAARRSRRDLFQRQRQQERLDRSKGLQRPARPSQADKW
jgi:hypothetical protein